MVRGGARFEFAHTAPGRGERRRRTGAVRGVCVVLCCVAFWTQLLVFAVVALAASVQRPDGEQRAASGGRLRADRIVCWHVRREAAQRRAACADPPPRNRPAAPPSSAARQAGCWLLGAGSKAAADGRGAAGGGRPAARKRPLGEAFHLFAKMRALGSALSGCTSAH